MFVIKENVSTYSRAIFCNRRKCNPMHFLRIEEVNATHPLSNGCIYFFK